jgi:hypothetical protein
MVSFRSGSSKVEYTFCWYPGFVFCGKVEAHFRLQNWTPNPVTLKNTPTVGVPFGVTGFGIQFWSPFWASTFFNHMVDWPCVLQHNMGACLGLASQSYSKSSHMFRAPAKSVTWGPCSVSHGLAPKGQYATTLTWSYACHLTTNRSCDPCSLGKLAWGGPPISLEYMNVHIIVFIINIYI